MLQLSENEKQSSGAGVRLRDSRDVPTNSNTNYFCVGI